MNENTVRCSFDEMVPLDKLTPHPKNPNKHSESQLNLLAKIISHQGWRSPIVVSKESGFIVAGHGRYLAAKVLKLKKAPVNFQTFDSDEDELAHLVADNRLSELSELNNDELTALLKELTGNIDLDLTGFDLDSVDRLVSGMFAKGENDPEQEWSAGGLPAFDGAESKHPRVVVHFPTVEDRDKFAKLINQDITNDTKYVWFPEAQVQRMKDHTV